MIDATLGHEELIQNSPLMAIIYNRPGKGDDWVIELGKNEVTYARTIDSPTEILTGQYANGEIVAISITDSNERKPLIQLQDPT